MEPVGITAGPAADQGNPTPGPAAQTGNPQTPTDWKAALPDELRGNPALASFKDVGALAKSYVEATKLIGSSIRIPGPNATPEERAAFLAKLGVPDSPDKYELRVDEGVRGLFDDQVLADFRRAAHRLGIPAAAAQGLVEWYSQHLAAAQRSISAQTKQVAEQLRQEWGDALYERNIALAQRVVREMGGEEMLLFLDQTGLGNNPALIKMLAKVGHLLAEDGHVPGEVEGALTPQQAQQKIAEIMRDPKDAYHNRSAVGHEERVAEVSRLFQIAYPSA